MSTVYTPTGSTYHASVTLPSDGDPAVAASVNAAGFQYLADNTAWLKLQDLTLLWDVTAYGLIGNNSFDNTTLLNALEADADTAGASLYWPAGTYRVTGTVMKKGRVSWFAAAPKRVTLAINHASNPLLEFDTFSLSGSGQTTPRIVISGMVFQAVATNNAGSIIYNPSAYDTNCEFHNCVFGDGDFSRGVLFDQSSAKADFLFTGGCLFRLWATNNAATIAGGYVTFGQYTRFSIPDTFASQDVVQVNGGVVNFAQPFFDGTDHATGANLYAIGLGGSTSQISITGGRFTDTAGAMAVLRKTASGGYIVSMSDGVRYEGAVPYVAGMTTLFTTSTLAQVPYVKSASSTTLLTYMRQQVYRSGAASAPSLTLPNGAFPGQQFSLILSNSSASDNWGAPTLLNVSELLVPAPELTFGSSAELNFLWTDLASTNTYVWVLVSVS